MPNGSIDISKDVAASALKRSSRDIVLLSSALIFALTIIAGKIWVDNNEACLRFIGCGKGFFGYDALEHFLWGLLVVAFSVGICKKFPSLTILHDGAFWKNIVLLLAVVALVSVSWEILEYWHDHVLNQFAFFNAITFLKPHTLAQPSNVDTMGDLTFNLLGGILGIFILNTNLLNNTTRTIN